ncbi:MAG: hypothetical protein FJ267_00625, partial [Planctomycetes bacterium]|nr:hypothetical protein [Planctomycetota bacterium]
CVCFLSQLSSGQTDKSDSVSKNSNGTSISQSNLSLPPRTIPISERNSLRRHQTTQSGGLWTTVIVLCVVASGIAVVSRFLRPYLSIPRTLPIDALEILGRRQIDSKVAIHLVRCGRKVLVLGISADDVRTLSEFTDPGDVDDILNRCSSPDSFPSSHSDESDSHRSSPESIDAEKTGKPLKESHRSRDRKVSSFLGRVVVAAILCLSQSSFAQESTNATRGPRTLPHQRSDNATPRSAQRLASETQTSPLSPTSAASTGAASSALDMLTFTSPEKIGTSLKVLVLVTVLGLVPSLLLMTTCFVRFAVVLSLLKQAIGTQQAPSQQVVTAISLFLTILVMSPVWQRCYVDGIVPYSQSNLEKNSMSELDAFQRTVRPIRKFMSQQIDRAGNADAVWMLIDFQRPDEQSVEASTWKEPQSYDDVTLSVLVPAYLLSELKVAFLIGFRIFLPFLVIDLIVASVLTTLGLTMLTPSLISLPFKLLLFVLIDGWTLTVGMLLESVRV